MPEGLRDAMLSREVFYLLFAFLGSRDCGSSQGCESETQGGWLAFLRGVQGTLIPLTVEEGKTQKAKFPMAQLMTLLSEVALTGQMVGDLGALMRLALRSSEIAILSGVQTSWEEAPVPLSSAVGFLTAISGVEVESLTGSASAEERMEEDGEPGEGEGLLLGEAWTSFPFAKVLCAVSKMVQGKTKASFDFGSIASLSSSLFALWSASQGEKAECIDSLNDEMELGMFSFEFRSGWGRGRGKPWDEDQGTGMHSQHGSVSALAPDPQAKVTLLSVERPRVLEYPSVLLHQQTELTWIRSVHEAPGRSEHVQRPTFQPPWVAQEICAQAPQPACHGVQQS